MNPLRQLALIAVLVGPPAGAADSATLAESSPFLPNGTAGIQSSSAGADTLELRGVMSASSGYLYYVYDPAKKRGVWAGNDDRENSFTIVAANAEEGHLEIRMNDGRLLNLKLREAKILSGGNYGQAQATPVSLPVGPGRAPNGLTETQKAWREEARRRMAENAADDKS